VVSDDSATLNSCDTGMKTVGGRVFQRNMIDSIGRCVLQRYETLSCSLPHLRPDVAIRLLICGVSLWNQGRRAQIISAYCDDSYWFDI